MKLAAHLASVLAKRVDPSWGSAFFREQALFAEAERWCQSVLPRSDFAAKKERTGARMQAP
jgi:hypothetical protein